jgi:Tol biopolymer transport system component
MVGTTLAHYRIVQPLGKGGMGEVFVAEDTKLHRKVALKVLPADVAIDPERRQRFEREAQAIAALNHPHIVTIHSVEQSGATHFLTMELVEGQTLAEIIPRHGLPLDRILKTAIPLADAVAAAHQKGITHRDLKPANIMVAHDGRVKVLDFGLAKLKEEQPLAGGLASMATGNITGEGKILGTVAYMSPEQAEGKAVDHRSDIFALGVLLYEMATGERPFKGDTSVSIISSIIKETPRSVTELNPTVPRELGRVIRRSLAKDPEDRYQSAKDVRNDLRELQQQLDSGELAAGAPAASIGRPARGRNLLLVGSGVLLIVVAAGAWFLRDRFTGRPAAPVAAGEVTQLTSEPRVEQFPNVSPDGKWFVYVSTASGNADIYLQSVGGRVPINLTKDSPQGDTQPVFSPDGEQIAFRSARQGGGIFVMGRTGESARRLTTGGFNPSWSPDGQEIAYATEQTLDNPFGRGRNSEMWAVRVATGAARRVFAGDGVQPRWSPHGHRIAYWSVVAGQRDLWTIRADGTDPQRITNDAAVDWGPVWAPDGKHLYFTSNRAGSMNIWRVAIDETGGKTLAAPEPITVPSEYVAYLSISADGRRLLYGSLNLTAQVLRVAFDPVAGKVVGTPAPVTTGSRFWFFPSPSPDGEWVAMSSARGQEDLYVVRSDGTGLRQLTNDAANDRRPEWSPDGKRIAFYSTRAGEYDVWTIDPDGSNLRQITKSPGGVINSIWAPDGRRIVTQRSLNLGRNLIVDVTRPWSEQSVEPLPEMTGGPFVPFSWSPDGLLLAGTRPGPPPGVVIYSFQTRTYRQVAERGGGPMWLNDNRRLLYAASTGPGTPNEVKLLDTATGQSQPVFAIPGESIGQPRISRDNRQIVFLRQSNEGDVWMLTLK